MATYTTPRTPGDLRQTPGRGAPPRRGTPPDPGLPPRRTVPPGRGMPPSSPRHTRPITSPGTGRPAKPATRPASRPVARPAIGRTRPRHPRAPFILLLVGLLGGALVSLLVISTTLAEGSYRITSLQQQNAKLAKQEQLLAQQVAQASSPTQIAQEAEQLGMRTNPQLQFINLKTGKVVSGHPSAADSEISVPGYTP